MGLWNWLSGKKTYIVALIAVILNIGVHYNWWTVADVNYWNTVLAGLGLAALRHGVSNS